MNRPSFNAMTEPWIPVIRLSGSRDELGLLSCLEQAHELREIRDPAPIIEFGIYRLLVAFVLDALILAGRRPEHPLDLKELISRGRFDMHMIEDYVVTCGDAFDLFHPDRPFLQEKMDAGKPKPLAGLYPVVPSGTNVNHWHHFAEDDLTVSSQVAARLLTTIAPFMTAGGAGLSPSINGAPAIYAMPAGASVFETILLSIPIRNRDSGSGVVAWRATRSAGEERTQATVAESLTWRPRRVQLLPEPQVDGSITVGMMNFERGDSTRLEWIDSNLAYRYEKDKVTPVRMREGRPLWRDAGPLLLIDDLDRRSGEDGVAFRRPDVVRQAFEITESDRPLRIHVYAMRTDMKMKVFEWTRSTVLVPCRLGRSTRLGTLVHAEIDVAERAARALRTCIRALYPREGAGNKHAMRSMGDRCERAFWQQLEPAFHLLMDNFSDLDETAADNPTLVEGTTRSWRGAVTDLATALFNRAAKDMDSDADALERQVHARKRLTGTLNKLL